MSSPTAPPISWLKHNLGDLCAPVAVEDDRPLVLDDWRHAYITLADHHELFSAAYRDGRPVGASEPVVRCPAGQVLFGVIPTPGRPTRVLLLSGQRGTAVWRVPICYLARLARQDSDCLAQVSALVDSWIRLLIDTLPKSPIPARARALRPGDPLEPGTGPVRAAEGLCWILPSRPPTSYRGIPVGTLAVPAPWWAISPDAAVMCSGSGLRVSSTADLLTADPSSSLLRGFMAFVAAAVCRQVNVSEPSQVERRSGTHRVLVPMAPAYREAARAEWRL